VRNNAPWILNVLRIDLRNPSIGLRHLRANDSLLTRERVSDIARRAASASHDIIAAVNTDFFDVASGRNENNVVVDGAWWRGLPITDSPFDTFDNIHSQFALDSLRRPLIERFGFRGVALGRSGNRLEFLTLNSPPVFPAPQDSADAAHLYTPRFGTRTPLNEASNSAELVLENIGRRRDTLLFTRVGGARREAGAVIPRSGAVLAGYGARAPEVAFLALSDTVKIVMGTRPPHAAPLALVVGGWPRILRAGVNIAANSASDEGTIERNAGVRHPRTAIGFSRDSTTLFLVTVDGRSAASAGMTIVDLADFMLELGVWDALYFDGGGSTTMVIQGRVVNTPADGSERAVGSALLVTRRRE
jgi:hypothetical protein